MKIHFIVLASMAMAATAADKEQQPHLRHDLWLPHVIVDLKDVPSWKKQYLPHHKLVATNNVFEATLKKDPDIIKTLGSTSSTEVADEDLKTASLLGGSPTEQRRRLQEGLLCFPPGDDGTRICYWDFAPGLIAIFSCPSTVQTIDDCQPTCAIRLAEDFTDITETTPACTGCNVCAADDPVWLSLDCGNILTGECAVQDCDGNCLGPSEATPVPTTPVPTPQPTPFPTTPVPTPESTPASTPTASQVCDPFNDPCFLIDQVDGMCDREVFPQCADGDCLDCDPCYMQYSYDCSACVANGCFWCPGDAVCSSYDITFNPAIRVFSCNQGEWLTSCPASDPDNVFSDPLYDSMKWAYDLINVEPVWREGLTGAGVHIRINDDGVDPNHPEFAGKLDVSNSCALYAPGSNGEGPETHGTATASIAAANANDECAVGIAPGATLSSCRVITDPGIESLPFVDGFLVSLQVVDVSSNSWGAPSCENIDPQRRLQQCPFDPGHEFSPCSLCDFSATPLLEDCEYAIALYCTLDGRDGSIDPACNEFLDLFVQCGFNALPENQQRAIDRAILEGRDGKGTIFVFATGNSFDYGSDVNYEPYANSRFTIGVGAVGKIGLHASYSTPGAAVFVSAPGGDLEFRSNNIVAKPGGGCHDITVGTSFSCPAVSGVIALMLEANPELGWRDVQGIIATTSQKTDSTDESWSTNGAGLAHSYKYGFGVIDASAAVTSARTWSNWGPELMSQVESGTLNLPITDDTTAVVTSTLTIADDLTVESVVVYLDVLHSSRGHLKVVLTTPSGTESILAPGKRPENSQMGYEERWKLMTVRAWGESSAGDWSLSVVDEEPGDVSECLDVADWLGVVEFADGDTIDVNCASLQRAEICLEGVPQFIDVDTITDEFGVSALEACCVCGGGAPASAINDMLESWRLVVYGHESPDDGPTTPPEPADSSTGRMAPISFSVTLFVSLLILILV